MVENSLQNRCIKKYYIWSWDVDAHSLNLWLTLSLKLIKIFWGSKLMVDFWINDPCLTDPEYLNDAKCETMIGWPHKFKWISFDYLEIQTINWLLSLISRIPCFENNHPKEWKNMSMGIIFFIIQIFLTCFVNYKYYYLKLISITAI